MARQEIVSRPGLDALLADGAQLWIAGQVAPLTSFKVRSMKFGETWCTLGVEDIAYRVAVPKQCLAAVMRRRHAAHVADGTARPAAATTVYDTLLRQHGWPDVDMVLADAELCRLAFEHYGHQTLLELEKSLATEARAAQLPRWVLNTIVGVDVTDGIGLLRGMARAPADGDDVKYQDA